MFQINKWQAGVQNNITRGAHEQIGNKPVSMLLPHTKTFVQQCYLFWIDKQQLINLAYTVHTVLRMLSCYLDCVLVGSRLVQKFIQLKGKALNFAARKQTIGPSQFPSTTAGSLCLSSSLSMKQLVQDMHVQFLNQREPPLLAADRQIGSQKKSGTMVLGMVEDILKTRKLLEGTMSNYWLVVGVTRQYHPVLFLADHRWSDIWIKTIN